eukprot:CAMPEP_0119432242 /NCGR_PEP_ID=MMETSP1335-20130426/47450_1 /TAXON_ID=259385 /ORGANISM="Chrysoculter rhomboideus, Strain RCC1486" /LENGTH=68 /DNA_ID=CAMNT_0007458061 /DNA_START=178 /DNA_END=384 /DNA_ORIENTATION=-
MSTASKQRWAHAPAECRSACAKARSLWTCNAQAGADLNSAYPMTPCTRSACAQAVGQPARYFPCGSAH